MIDANGQYRGLGTLVYLPAEIRNHIYAMVLEDQFDSIISDYREYAGNFTNAGEQDQDIDNMRKWQLHYQPGYQRCHDYLDSSMHNTATPSAQSLENHKDLEVFEIRTYVPWLADYLEKPDVSVGLPRASRNLGIEFNNYFLGRCTFKFDCPGALETFLSKLCPSQQMILPGIVLEVMNKCYCFTKYHANFKTPVFKDWMDVCGRSPETLQCLRSVKFELGECAHPIPCGGREGFWDTSGERYGGGATPMYLIPNKFRGNRGILFG